MEAADFINKCLQRKPANRLGLNGPNEVKQHVWLRDIDWMSIIEMKVQPTFIPSKYILFINLAPRPPLTSKQLEKD